MSTTNLWKTRLGGVIIVAAMLSLAGTLGLAQIRENRAPPPGTAPPTSDPVPGLAGERPAEGQPQPGRNPAQPADRNTAPPAGQIPIEGQPARLPARPADEQPREAARDGRPDENLGPVVQRRRGLGIQFDIQPGGGLSVTAIEDDSLAAQAGLQAQDKIVSVDGRKVASPRQLQAYLSGQYGRRIPLVIERGGRQYTIQLAMDEPQADAPWLGVYLQDNEENQTGARIMQVYPAGPAARAGLRSGDTVLLVNGQQVDGSAELIALVNGTKPADRAEFVVLRGKNEIKLPVTIGRQDGFVMFGQPGFEDGDESNEFSRIPQYAMQLEHDRRMAEQHERIENELVKLQEEVRKLRELIEKR